MNEIVRPRLYRPPIAIVYPPTAKSEASAIHARRQESAIHRDALARDEARCIGGQQHGGSNQFLPFSKAAHGSAQQKLAAPVGTVEQRGVQIRAENSRRDRVDIDA